MQRAEILDVRPGPDDDRFVVAPQDRAKPDADVAPQSDIADHARIGSDPVVSLEERMRASAFEANKAA